MGNYNFGNYIYEKRIEKKLSQTELGQLLGITNKTISKWEFVMINRDDMLELTRRMTPARSCFDRIAGAYIDDMGEVDESFNIHNDDFPTFGFPTMATTALFMLHQLHCFIINKVNNFLNTHI